MAKNIACYIDTGQSRGNALKQRGIPLPFSAGKHVYSEIFPDVMEQGSIWMAAAI